ncbi:MAG: FG-GAP repeat protein, partial [Myxococcales bacterium]|nr:FG-GAP repeat protein [Myxococcales bacterium]
VWTEVQKLQASDGGSGERFGYSMVIEGDALVVGAPRALIDGVETGAAYVFRREPGGWSEVAKLVPTDGEEDDKFGEHVALRGGQLLVSSPGYNGQGNAMGAAYLFSAP